MKNFDIQCLFSLAPKPFLLPLFPSLSFILSSFHFFAESSQRDYVKGKGRGVVVSEIFFTKEKNVGEGERERERERERKKERKKIRMTMLCESVFTYKEGYREKKFMKERSEGRRWHKCKLIKSIFNTIPLSVAPQCCMLFWNSVSKGGRLCRGIKESHSVRIGGCFFKKK